VRELQAFAAVVYSSNFEAESPSVAGVAGAVPEVVQAVPLTEDEVEGFESAWGKAAGR
jgi:hypothetical protein